MQPACRTARLDTLCRNAAQIYITRLDLYPEASSIIHWRQQAEEAVRSSRLPYMIVRPSWLTDDAGEEGIRFEQSEHASREPKVMR